MISSLAEAELPVPMKAIRVGAIDWDCGWKKRVELFDDFSGRKVVKLNTSLVERLAPIRSPISSAIETRPPPL